MSTSIDFNNTFDLDWLAGFIDGDGCFLISRSNYGALEITVATPDLPLLRHVQQVYGGSIKPRAGGTSIRYRLHNRPNFAPLSWRCQWATSQHRP